MNDKATGFTGGIAVGVIGALATVIAAVLAAVATGWFGFASKDEELRVHLVEIAIGILRADPKEDVTPARAWAIDIIEKNSGVPFKADDRAALLHKPILSRDLGGWKPIDPNQPLDQILKAHPAPVTKEPER